MTINKKQIVKIAGTLILYFCVNTSYSQKVDLSSVDKFIKITSNLNDGKQISAEQWNDFDKSTGYKKYAESENKFILNTVQESIKMVFSKTKSTEIDIILGISKDSIAKNIKLMFEKRILTNFIDMNKNYASIKSFRENYDFNAYVEKSKQRLFTFLGTTADSSFKFKTVYFNCMDAEGGNDEDAVYLDFNLVYKMSEEQRINFLAHEFFHNYREKFENQFRRKCDLNSGLDMIQNEGIADMIDKTGGYQDYFTSALHEPELARIMVGLYDQAQEDMEKLQRVILKYTKGEISETQMIDKWLEIAKFNGHAIGCFMANQIIKAGYKNEMIKSFYNPYEFYSLYNKAAQKQNIFQFSDELMNYLKDITKEYYR